MLVGFSMGTGEVTRYLGRYGSAGVAKARDEQLIADLTVVEVEGGPHNIG